MLGLGFRQRHLAQSVGQRDAVVVLQANRRTHPDLPQVPQAIKLAKTDEGRKMIDVGIHSDSDIVRTYTLPPGTPKDRVQLLRKAFEDTLKDPEFLADAKKSKLNVDPVPADVIEKDISALFKLDPGDGRQTQGHSLQLTLLLI